MYESFYGLKTKPFNTLPDPDFLFMSKKHEMALTYLEYGLTSQAGFMVLTGEIGSGKTTLINYLMDKIDNRETKAALVFNTNLKPREFLEAVLNEWNVPGTNRGKSGLYDELNAFLLDEYKRQARVLLIIDEAQNLPFETLEEIRMISNLNDEKVPLIHIILSGQPNLLNRLNSPELEQMRQRVSVHYHLEPLERDETAAYITHRLKKAVAEDLAIFDANAVERIYIHSGGIPRVINLICDIALVYGYAEQIKPIGADIIDLVVEDRKKMGLVFEPTQSKAKKTRSAASKNAAVYQIDSLEKKYDELNDNVYRLALLVKKMLGIKEHLEKLEQKQQQLRAKVNGLEKRLTGPLYQRVFRKTLEKENHGKTDTKNN